jgi:hypothetical protein
VPRVGEQRERPRGEAGRDLAGHEADDQDERDRQRTPVGTAPVRVVMVVAHPPMVADAAPERQPDGAETANVLP